MGFWNWGESRIELRVVEVKKMRSVEERESEEENPKRKIE